MQLTKQALSQRTDQGYGNDPDEMLLSPSANP